MRTQKAQIVIEVDVEIPNRHGRLSANDVLGGIVLQDSDVVDGYELTTNIKGCDPTTDFFLKNGRIASKQYMSQILSTKRREELFHNMLNHITELVSGNDLFRTLKAIGFTIKEMAICDIDLEEDDEISN